MSEIAIPVIVLSERRDDAEFFNKTLRDAGHAVRCRWLYKAEDFGPALEAVAPHLIVFFASHHGTAIGEVASLREVHAPMSPVIVIVDYADESAISQALADGAQDLVSVEHAARICAVCERELKAYRNESALSAALHSAMQYKKQLQSMLSSSADAIAIVQEGIVVEANQAWADLFSDSDLESAIGPVMDHFAPANHTTLKQALGACVTGRSEREMLYVECANAGGEPFSTYIAFEHSIHDGEPAVRLCIEQSRAAPEPADLDSLVEQTLHTDLATGFLQRRQFLELLTKKLERPAAKVSRALAFVQPDRFEEIESDLGPVSSEEIIGQIAEVLGDLMNDCDLSGRFGSKTLALVVERSAFPDIQAWAESARARIEEHLFEVSDRSLSLTCSFGIAELGEGSDRVEDLIRSAERATERAHDAGGNGIVLEESSDESTRIKRVDEIMIRQIKAALVEGRFRLMHLNIASLSGKAERIYDTFLRMVDMQGDEVGASEFIDTARRNGMLRTVDRWVIDASIAFCGQRSSDLVFIKLSHDSVLDTSLWRWIDEQASKAGIKPDRLCFQVTEEDASKFQKQTRALAECLRRRGFKFAIEHFGIGRDPLRILSVTPMDFVKFDGSLCKGLADDAGAREKLKAFVASAAEQQIQTIATQVENANTMAMLFQLGVGYMQGHYLHEPEVVLEAVV